MSVGEKLLEELRQNPELKLKLAYEIAEAIVQHEEVRRLTLEALVRDVATRRDLAELETRLRKEIREVEDRLRSEIKETETRLRSEIHEVESRLRSELKELQLRIGTLEQRVARLEATTSLLVKMFIAFNTPLLIAVIGILLKLVLFT